MQNEGEKLSETLGRLNIDTLDAKIILALSNLNLANQKAGELQEKFSAA
jgi:hypothetical protein